MQFYSYTQMSLLGINHKTKIIRHFNHFSLASHKPSSYHYFKIFELFSSFHVSSKRHGCSRCLFSLNCFQHSHNLLNKIVNIIYLSSSILDPKRTPKGSIQISFISIMQTVQKLKQINQEGKYKTDHNGEGLKRLMDDQTEEYCLNDAHFLIQNNNLLISA